MFKTWHSSCCVGDMRTQFAFGTRTLVLIALGLGLVAACGVDQPEAEAPKPGQTSFISSVPASDNSRGVAEDGGDLSAGPVKNDASAPPADGVGDAARAIAEADIVKVEGNTLYALSRYSGLSIIDIADPSHLKMLGNHRANATPFEMYVEGTRAYVMYNAWSHYELDPTTSQWSWQSASRIQALDVSNPRKITVIGEHDMSGELSDSRKVGDVLYLVTHENGFCWQCDTKPNTRVTSFDVKDPNEFALIDELRLVDSSGYGGKRSIAVTEERIYVSGRSWGGEEGGVIDVIDIADPGGDLVTGAEVPVAGPIDSRWQIDEFNGVLRVISQPGGWGTASVPAVETFQLVSTQEVTPLARLDMQLPPNEVLRSVRFDGARAYAITMEQKDPLFTFDLSDAENPRQLGELVIPGWVYHMEPRGDRVYALGFDDAVNGGALHVSLFDVSVLSEPKQLARVNFGGQWASFSEDQDRIHKAFNIMEDEGLILVPFSGWDYATSGDECSYGTFLSGIQLVDMGKDDLTLRGVAPQVGEARRGFLANGALFGLSDNALQTFNIEDRDHPAALGELETARNISQIRVMGDSMLRFGSDWWTGRTTLDFAAQDTVETAEPQGDIDLSKFVPQEDSCTSSAYWENQVLVHGDFAYVPRRAYSWGTKDGVSEASQSLTFYVLDISEKASPKVIGTFASETHSNAEYLSQVIKTDGALLVGRYTGSYSYDPSGQVTSQPTFSYDVYSLQDPAQPSLVSSLQVPDSLAYGGYGYNVTGCMVDVGWGWWPGYGAGQAIVSGDIVASQHQESLNDGTGRVRYFLDRLDVSDPAEPKLLAKVNVPGGVVDFDHVTGRTVTLDYLEHAVPARSWDECYQALGRSGYNYDSERGLCLSYNRAINTLRVRDDVATLVDSAGIDSDGVWANHIAVTKTRVFANFSAYGDNTYSSNLRVFALGSTEANAGKLTELDPVDLGSSGLSYGYMLARGDRAFISEAGLFTVVDTSDHSHITTKTHEMSGYYCESLEVSESSAYCALGYQGVQEFPLE